jgi:GntR family transcriptional regulator
MSADPNADMTASLYGAMQPGETMAINRDSPVPLHHQVRNYLLGILDLVKEGYFSRIPGRGTFVREEKVEEKISILSSFSESMRAKGLNAILRVVDQRVGMAPPSLKATLETNDQQFVFLQRVALVEGKAIALLSSYLPARLVPGLETLDFNGRSLYKTLEERYGIVLARAESTIEVVRCHSTQSTVLGIPPGTAMLQVEGKTYDVTDQFVEFAQVLYRADRFRFTIESFRRDDRVLHLIGAPDIEEGTGS